MTLEEAIKHCEDVARQNEEDAILYSNCKKHKKNLFEIGLAENAEKKCCKCAEDHRQLAKWLKELKAYREQSGDTISRQAVLDLATTIETDDYTGNEILKVVDIDDIKALPSVTPQQRTGRWIDDKCSVCGKGIEDLIVSPEWYRNEEPNFCPFCGIKMEIKECENCKHYGEDLHGVNCRFCQDMKLWEVKENG